jgi:hypothetical protein
MYRVLLVSDNEKINDLYFINLFAYTAVKIITKPNYAEGFKLLEVLPDIDIIITLKENEKELTILELNEYLNNKIKKNNKTSIIIMGEKEQTVKDIDNVIAISNIFDIKTLNQTVAKFFEINAMKMANRPVPDYFPIPVDIFSSIKETPCDLYFRNKKSATEFEYVKSYNQGNDISNIKDDLILKDIDYLYVPSEKRLFFINQASANILHFLNKEDLPMEERIELISKGIEVIAFEVLKDEVAVNDVVYFSKMCVNATLKVIKDTPQFKHLFNAMLKYKDEYIFVHSILATYVASKIIENISWGIQEHLDKVTFVLFYHDIFLVQFFHNHPNIKTENQFLLNNEINDDLKDIISEKEKELILNHARLASELLTTLKHIPLGADTIIKQHHGLSSGVGFTDNYEEYISSLSKVIIIAEDFTIQLLNDHNISHKKVIKKLYKKYPKSSYKKMISALEKSNI